MNRNVWNHFKVITRHKWEVMKNCFRRSEERRVGKEC